MESKLSEVGGQESGHPSKWPHFHRFEVIAASGWTSVAFALQSLYTPPPVTLTAWLLEIHLTRPIALDRFPLDLIDAWLSVGLLSLDVDRSPLLTTNNLKRLGYDQSEHSRRFWSPPRLPEFAWMITRLGITPRPVLISVVAFSAVMTLEPRCVTPIFDK